MLLHLAEFTLSCHNIIIKQSGTWPHFKKIIWRNVFIGFSTHILRPNVGCNLTSQPLVPYKSKKVNKFCLLTFQAIWLKTSLHESKFFPLSRNIFLSIFLYEKREKNAISFPGICPSKLRKHWLYYFSKIMFFTFL